jgi:Tol biopolymer transport system component
MKVVRLPIAAALVTASILACALPSPSPVPQQDLAATIVIQTMQALSTAAPPISPSAAPAATSVSPTTIPSLIPNILPHSLYFLSNDKTGLLQIFRMERDGKSVNQITFEPAAVNSFDVTARGGAVAFISNNQLLWVDANGAGRRVLLDGGPVSDNDRFTQSVGTPVWSPDGGTIAFSHNGLNFYTMSTGVTNNVMENKIDNSAGFPVVRELYAPALYSPDGSRLLINISFNESGTFGIYSLGDNTLVRIKRTDGGIICCTLRWVPGGGGLYAASSTIGVIDSGLWYINAADGTATTLLPGSAPDGTYNFADAPNVGADGQLYFFFNNLKEIPASGHTPLYLVRSGTDGVSGRTLLKPDVLQNINEILWAPDGGFAVVAFAPAQDVSPGGQAEIVYLDDRPDVILTSFAEQMRWGP